MRDKHRGARGGIRSWNDRRKRPLAAPNRTQIGPKKLKNWTRNIWNEQHSVFLFFGTSALRLLISPCQQVLGCVSYHPLVGPPNPKKWILQTILYRNDVFWAFLKIFFYKLAQILVWTSKKENEKENEWHRVTISLRMGGQGLPTAIYTSPSPSNMHKKYLKRLFSRFSI